MSYALENPVLEDNITEQSGFMLSIMHMLKVSAHTKGFSKSGPIKQNACHSACFAAQIAEDISTDDHFL